MTTNNVGTDSQLKTSSVPWHGEEFCNYNLAKLTTWYIGGQADKLYIPLSIVDLAAYIGCTAKNIPLTVIGLGSNLLIRDSGIEGLVISTKYLNQIKLNADNTVYAEAGVTCAKLAKFCSKNNLSGGEFFAGIPGTVGGALAMNAGAFGGETWNLVNDVNVLDRSGEIYSRIPEDYDIGYRKVIARNNENLREIFIAGNFKLNSSDCDSTDKIKKLLQERNQKQPIGTRNCGSVFRNPPGDHAARLIEACGLKGYSIGGAIISPKHANFIINDNNATSDDVENLIKFIQNEVLAKFKIQLIPEVRIVGKPRSGDQ